MALAVALLGCGDAGSGGGHTSSLAAPSAPATGPEIDRCSGCSVVLISIDTLRADRLGAYGNPRQPTPHLDRLAAGGVVFENAYSVSYHTADSHMSMMTSLYPSVHMVRNAVAGGGRKLEKGVSTLAQLLRRAGYETAGLHGGGNVGRVYGFARGFDLYRRAESIGEAVDWLEERADPGAKPYFLFVHTYHPHDPYTPAREWVERFDPGYEGPILSDRDELLGIVGDGGFGALRDEFWSRVDPEDPRAIEHLLALYDGEIAEVDRKVGELLDYLATLPEPPLVLLVSDHGEEFYEHGKFLHDQLYNELLHVPLIVHGPGVPAGHRVSARTSLLDLAPTVLDLVGVEPPDQFQGDSLLPVVSGRRVPAEVYAEKVRPKAAELASRQRPISVFGLIRDDHKLIVRGRPKLFDLVQDPGETEPIADNDRLRPLAVRARELVAANAAHRERLGIPLAAETQGLDEETRQQLKALGYIQ